MLLFYFSNFTLKYEYLDKIIKDLWNLQNNLNIQSLRLQFYTFANKPPWLQLSVSY